MPELRRIVAVYGGSFAHHRALHEPKYARSLAGCVYLPVLAATDLSDFSCTRVARSRRRRAWT